jgi:hypothetical protein
MKINKNNTLLAMLLILTTNVIGSNPNNETNENKPQDKTEAPKKEEPVKTTAVITEAPKKELAVTTIEDKKESYLTELYNTTYNSLETQVGETGAKSIMVLGAAVSLTALIAAIYKAYEYLNESADEDDDSDEVNCGQDNN